MAVKTKQNKTNKKFESQTISVKFVCGTQLSLQMFVETNVRRKIKSSRLKKLKQQIHKHDDR